MRLQNNVSYYVYIVTNTDKTALHSGFTSELSFRLYQHEYDVRNRVDNAVAKQGCTFLVYWERLSTAAQAMEREREIREYSNKRKEALISKFNPGWRFLNNDFAIANFLYE